MNILPSTEVLDSRRFPEINQTHASDRLIKMHDRVIHDPREEIFVCFVLNQANIYFMVLFEGD